MQVDKVPNLSKIKDEAEEQQGVICISARTGDGVKDFLNAIQEKLKVCTKKIIFKQLSFDFYYKSIIYTPPTFILQDSLIHIEALIPYDKGELLSTIHEVGVVEGTVSIKQIS